MFFLKFAKLHKKRPSLEKLPEADIVEGAEEVCDDKFENYGVKEVNKIKRLSGPGLETKDVPGVMEGGGKWPVRLKSMCYQYLEEFGDEVIYREYLKNKNLQQFFCKSNKKPDLTDVCLSEHEKTRNKTENEKRRNKTAEADTKGDQIKDEL
ncbi:hypothetical protein CHS0354_028079 [Potamilus streckersoni]|uniref:Uncharacterized protein n=1 Tax=Potamilus streckersoni TaxID=2493646 RepID=A0AAE0TI76_9BIVA|nr:hypothetical protein CHS0354_028079 [Potamilus streckersoni]